MYIILGAVLGAATGYLISDFMNKRNVAACTILCNKRISMIYFGLLGALFASV
jgi:hypothetical protein